MRDRIDINQAFLPLRKAYLRRATLQRAESSAAVAELVLEARDRQRRRLAGSGWQTNGEVSGTYLRRHLPLPDGLQAVDDAVDRGRLSARTVLRDLGLTSNQVWGLTRTDQEWSEKLDAALTATRRDDLERGTNAAYVQGCVCSECRRHQRIRMARSRG